jgi:hypothetical protein
MEDRAGYDARQTESFGSSFAPACACLRLGRSERQSLAAIFGWSVSGAIAVVMFVGVVDLRRARRFKENAASIANNLSRGTFFAVAGRETAGQAS